MTTTMTRPDSAYQRAVENTRRQFEASTENHRMTVLNDSVFVGGAPYRHVRFSEPGTEIWSFDLVTWPGHLAISGDLKQFLFRRTNDMFGFFNTRDINPGYWAEKCVAGETEGFCVETYKESIERHLESYLTDRHDQPKFGADDTLSIRNAVRDELIEADPYTVDYARQMLSDFYAVLPSSGNTFAFEGTYDWDVEGYLHHFLLSCHAIRWGVQTYLAEHPTRLIDKKD